MVIMERVAVFFKIIPGKEEEYEQAHAQIWPEMRRVLDDAGFRNYSIWRKDTKLFAYYEVKNPKRCEEVLTKSEVYRKWREYMKNFVWYDPDTGQAEYFMKQVFYSE